MKNWVAEGIAFDVNDFTPGPVLPGSGKRKGTENRKSIPPPHHHQIWKPTDASEHTCLGEEFDENPFF